MDGRENWPDGYGGPPVAGTEVKGWLLLFVSGLFVAGVATLCLVYDGVREQDVLFVLGFGGYLWLANAVIYELQPTSKLKPLTFQRKPWTRLLLAIGLVLTTGLPWYMILTNGRPAVVRVYCPHLFLFMSQVLLELWSYRKVITLPTRILVPVGFTFYRLRVLETWYREAMDRDGVLFAEPIHAYIALANGVYWVFVFVFVLLLNVIPSYLDPPPPRAPPTPPRRPDHPQTMRM